MKLKCECRMHTLIVSSWRASDVKCLSFIIEEKEEKVGRKKGRFLGDVLLDKGKGRVLLEYLQRWVKP